MISKLFEASVNIPLNFSFLGIEARDLLDIIVVAFLVYAFIILLKKARSLFLLNGVAVLALIYIAARYLNLYLTSLLFSVFFGFFIIIFAVVFQRELRRFFEWLSVWLKFSRAHRELIPEMVSNHIIQAADYFAKNRVGALIVFPGEEPIDTLIDGGIPLEGKISTPLLLSIFDTSSPGHDGAVIVEGDRVRLFGAHLPLARNMMGDIKNFGTRHRAALGLAERSDSLVLVVSEEKGTISVAENGKLETLKDTTELAFRVHDFLSSHLLEEGAGQKRWLTLTNFKEKIASLAIAILLWYVFVLQAGTGTITRNFEVPIEFRSLPAGYTIEAINPAELSISLSGKNQDFSFLNPDRLKVVVDFSQNENILSAGKHNFEVEDKNVLNLPASVSVIRLYPKTIQFTIQEKLQNRAIQSGINQ